MAAPPFSPGEYAIALAPGSAITERYVVAHVLGTPGGFGITYLAKDLLLDRLVAVKEFLPRVHATRGRDRTTVEPHSDADEPHFRTGLNQFLDEGRRLAKIRHPNVVGVQNFCEAHGTAYLVMDYYVGRTLAELLVERGGRLPVDEAIRVVDAVLDGLAATHAANIWHRDVKPSNIYITTEGVPILLDFGAARQGSASSLTSILTHGFAPIEQYGAHGQGPWTDVYAAAAVLYVLLTGEQPSAATMRAYQAVDPLVPPHKVLPEIPEALSLAVVHGMAFQASHRPQSASEFKAILGKALATVAQSKREPVAKSPLAGIGAALKTYAMPITSAAVVIAVVGLGLWKLAGRGTAPPADSSAAQPAGARGSVAPSTRFRDSIARAESLAGARQKRVRDSVARARADSANQARAALAIARRDSAKRAQQETDRSRQAAVSAAADSAVRAQVETPPKPPAPDGRMTAATRAAAENRLLKEAELIAQSVQRGSVEGFDERLARFVRSKKNLEAGTPTLSDTKIVDASASATAIIPLSWKSDFGATRKDVLQIRIGLQLVGSTWQRAAVTMVHIP